MFRFLVELSHEAFHLCSSVGIHCVHSFECKYTRISLVLSKEDVILIMTLLLCLLHLAVGNPNGNRGYQAKTVLYEYKILLETDNK